MRESGSWDRLLLVAMFASCLGCGGVVDPPELIEGGALHGSSLIGHEAIVDPGDWEGADTISLQWLVDGTPIPGANGAVYVPVEADDLHLLACEVTARGADATQRHVTEPVAVTREAPTVVEALDAHAFGQHTGSQRIDAAAAFSGDDLTFSVEGAGASVDPETGVITLATDAAIADSITVTARNSGGDTSFELPVTVVSPGQPEVTPASPPAHASTLLVHTRAELLNAIAGSVDGDIITIAPGVYDRFVWPKSTSHHLTLVAAQRANPPIMRGIWISANPASYFPAQSARGTWAKNLTIDGLRFQAELLDRIRTQKNSTHTVDITDSHGRGWGWRADFSYPGVANLGESAGFVGLKIGAGSDNVVVENCLFESFAKAINTGAASHLTVRNNEFSEIAEDAVIIWGGTDLTFEYNLWDNSRGISLAAAHAYGWSSSTVPPHQDFFQIACNSATQYVTRLTIRDNVMYDNTERVHGVLLNNAYVGGSTAAKLQNSRHRDVVVDNNFFDQTHTTGIQLTNTVGLTARHNKVMRQRVIAGSSKNDVAFVVGSWGRADAQNMANVRIQDNVSRKFKGPWNAAWIWTGNRTSNAADVFPPGWVEMRPGVAPARARKAGRYGTP